MTAPLAARSHARAIDHVDRLAHAATLDRHGVAGLVALDTQRVTRGRGRGAGVDKDGCGHRSRPMKASLRRENTPPPMGARR